MSVSWGEKEEVVTPPILCRLGYHRLEPLIIPHTYRCTRLGCHHQEAGHP